MIFATAKTLCWLHLVTSVLALYDSPTFTSDTHFYNEDFLAADVEVPEEQVAVTIINAPKIDVTGSLNNKGKVIIRTNAAAESGPGGSIDYTFGGHICNRGSLIVYHSCPEKRLHVTLPGGSPPGARTAFWSNYGEIILSSNGAEDSWEFEISLECHFANKGLVMVLGTAAHTAQMRLTSTDSGSGVFPPALYNRGMVFLKHAVFEQLADFDSLGCVAMDRGATFVADATLYFGSLRFYFLWHDAVLHIKTEGLTRLATYYVTAFPPGAEIRFDEHMTRIEVDGNDVTVLSALGDIRVRIVFEAQHLAIPEKFVFSGGKLSYASVFLYQRKDDRCSGLNRAISRALAYEIPLGTPH